MKTTTTAPSTQETLAMRCAERQHWVFDVDETLYPSSCGIFDDIKVRITDYVATHLNISREEAYKVQHDYYLNYGTTLCGMVLKHGVDSQHFLDYVHDVDYAIIQEDKPLRNAIERLRDHGRSIHIYTNADQSHACKVLHSLGVADLFPTEIIFDIIKAQFVPKPLAESVGRFLTHQGIKPHHSVFIDDLPQNLIEPARAGMIAIHLDRQTKNSQSESTKRVDFIIEAALDVSRSPKP